MRDRRTSTVILALLLLAPATEYAAEEKLNLPWKQAGLTEAQAAAHLLDRFAYGARPGDVQRVVEMGLENWLAEQLRGDLPDQKVDAKLKRFKSLTLTTRDIIDTYPNPGLLLREARRAGVISDEDVARAQTERGDERRRNPKTRQAVFEYAREQGYRPARELVGEMMIRKLYRALYSKNQLSEVLTDFWFNHFNVSLTDKESRNFISTYERDAIRPHVLGDFRDMLEATAKHPAMLLYLDNARSVADESAEVTFDADRLRPRRRRQRGGLNPETRERLEQRRPRGLNENYARELLELHTLGVDGGYTQDDVIEVARALTGWTTFPTGPRRDRMDGRIEQVRGRMARAGVRKNGGFVFEDDFLFRADVHDAGPKTVLGQKLPGGRGMEDGLQVLDIVAAHASTARHLATKLATRFVSDTPPEPLVDRLAQVYSSTAGDLKQLVVTLAESPEFWSVEARRKKIKSPFEVAASALRATAAEVTEPRETVEWISRMGQPLYAYQAPTGYPDRAEFWVNTGSLLSRMNFGLQLATGRIGGVHLDLPALNQHREPESLTAALRAYVPILLPERDTETTVSRLEPMLRDPDLARKIEEAAPVNKTAELDLGDWDDPFEGKGRRQRGRWAPRPTPQEVDSSPLAHVVGVILGSPEFQRR